MRVNGVQSSPGPCRFLLRSRAFPRAKAWSHGDHWSALASGGWTTDGLKILTREPYGLRQDAWKSPLDRGPTTGVRCLATVPVRRSDCLTGGVFRTTSPPHEGSLSRFRRAADWVDWVSARCVFTASRGPAYAEDRLHTDNALIAADACVVKRCRRLPNPYRRSRCASAYRINSGVAPMKPLPMGSGVCRPIGEAATAHSLRAFSGALMRRSSGMVAATKPRAMVAPARRVR